MRRTLVEPVSLSREGARVLVDFGREYAGRLLVTTKERADVLVSLGESLDEARENPERARIRLSGRGRLATPETGFRHALLETSSELDAISLENAVFPLERRGSFRCSDPLLERIWEVGAHTVEQCTHDVIWDGPKRDREAWAGDALVEGATLLAISGDAAPIHATLRELRDGAQGHVNAIPGYTCAWILLLGDVHRHAPDEAFLREQREPLIAFLDVLSKDMRDGAFANASCSWCFVDWAPNLTGEFPEAHAATHLQLVAAAREAAFLLDELGDARALPTRAWAGELARAAAHLPSSDSPHVRALRPFAGLASTCEVPASATPYFAFYALRGLSTRGALGYVREVWGGMLSCGATTFFETFDRALAGRTDFHRELRASYRTGFGVSLCHGWSTAPTSWLTRTVLGVRPVEAGRSRANGDASFVVAPDLGDLAWAEGVVPTPSGDVRVRVEPGRVEISGPATLAS